MYFDPHTDSLAFSTMASSDIGIIREYIDYVAIAPIATLGVLGNLLTTLVFSSIKQKRAYHRYIIFLSVFDMLYCAIFGGGLLVRSSKAVFRVYHWYAITFRLQICSSKLLLLGRNDVRRSTGICNMANKICRLVPKERKKMIYIITGVMISVTLCLHIPYLFPVSKPGKQGGILNQTTVNESKIDPSDNLEAIFEAIHQVNNACFIYGPIVTVLVANTVLIILLRRRCKIKF